MSRRRDLFDLDEEHKDRVIFTTARGAFTLNITVCIRLQTVYTCIFAVQIVWNHECRHGSEQQPQTGGHEHSSEPSLNTGDQTFGLALTDCEASS